MLKKVIILVGIILLLPLIMYATGDKSSEMSEINQGKVVAIAPLFKLNFMEKYLPTTMSSSFQAVAVLQDKPDEENKAIKQKLVGQLRIRKSRIELPNPQGHNIYQISVKGGRAKLSHYSYNPDGHTWSIPPRNKQSQYINIDDTKNYFIEINIDETYGQKDKVFLVNPSLWGSIDVECRVSKD